MGFWDSIGSTMADINIKTEAKKTNNFDKYTKAYKDTKKLLYQKKEAMRLVLKQDRFKTLKIELEEMKKEM